MPAPPISCLWAVSAACCLRPAALLPVCVLSEGCAHQKLVRVAPKYSPSLAISYPHSNALVDSLSLGLIGNDFQDEDALRASRKGLLMFRGHSSRSPTTLVSS